MQGREEVSIELVVTGGDGAVVFEFVKETFNEIALCIEGEVTNSFDRAVDLGGKEVVRFFATAFRS